MMKSYPRANEVVVAAKPSLSTLTSDVQMLRAGLVLAFLILLGAEAWLLWSAWSLWG